MADLHIIAEAGTNHNGNPATARALVDTAAACGADSVKFQIIHPEGLYVPGFPGDDGYRENPVLEKRRQTMLSDADYEALWEHAARVGIPVTASVFDVRGIALLDRLGVPFIKLASCDLNNDGLIRRAATTGRRLILATGMSTLQEIEHAVRVASDAGSEPVLLHCVSLYPTPAGRAHVGFVATLKQEFGVEVGFSDHTETETASIAAVALGATWFEKHFTQDRNQEGFDHGYAMEPEMLSRYITSVREAGEVVANHSDKISAEEARVAMGSRRALYAARDLRAGETLSESDVLVVRPSGPLAPGDLPKVLGARVAREIPRHAPLAWSDLEA